MTATFASAKQPGAVLEVFQGLVVEGRVGREAAEHSRRQGNPGDGRQELCRQADVHDPADEEGAEHVDREGAPREPHPEDRDRPPGDQIARPGPRGASQADPEKAVHARALCITRGFDRIRRQKGDRSMKRSLSVLIGVIAFLSVSMLSLAAATKTYQVTGQVVMANQDMIVVMKGDERWEIMRDAGDQDARRDSGGRQGHDHLPDARGVRRGEARRGQEDQVGRRRFAAGRTSLRDHRGVTNLVRLRDRVLAIRRGRRRPFR